MNEKSLVRTSLVKDMRKFTYIGLKLVDCLDYFFSVGGVLAWDTFIFLIECLLHVSPLVVVSIDFNLP